MSTDFVSHFDDFHQAFLNTNTSEYLLHTAELDPQLFEQDIG